MLPAALVHEGYAVAAEDPLTPLHPGKVRARAPWPGQEGVFSLLLISLLSRPDHNQATFCVNGLEFTLLLDWLNYWEIRWLVVRTVSRRNSRSFFL